MTVIRAPFERQVVHIANADDAPVCGAEPEAAFVAELVNCELPKLKDTQRWCSSCASALGFVAVYIDLEYQP